MANTSVVVMSEFGRRVRENASGGTDHGYGNIMMALGGALNGGRTFGTFAGLSTPQLFEGADVQVTTDCRRVLSEAVIRRLRNPSVYCAFPGYSGYAPIGIFTRQRSAADRLRPDLRERFPVAQEPRMQRPGRGPRVRCGVVLAPVRAGTAWAGSGCWPCL